MTVDNDGSGEDPKLRGLKMELRALLLSTKEQTDMQRFNRDYRDVQGHPIPFQKFGYHTLLDFLESMPDVVKISNQYGQIFLRGRVTESTQHVQRLVTGQRKKKRGPGGLGSAPPAPPRRFARGGYRPTTPRVGDSRDRVKQHIMDILNGSRRGMNFQQLDSLYLQRHGQNLSIRNTFNLTARVFFSSEMAPMVDVGVDGRGQMFLRSRAPNMQPPPRCNSAIYSPQRPSTSFGGGLPYRSPYPPISGFRPPQFMPFCPPPPFLPAPFGAPPMRMSPPARRVYTSKSVDTTTTKVQLRTVNEVKSENKVCIPRPAELCTQVTALLCDAYPHGIALDDLEAAYERKHGFPLDINKNFHKSWHEWLTSTMKSLAELRTDTNGGIVAHISPAEAKKHKLEQRATRPPVKEEPVNYGQLNVTVNQDSDERRVSEAQQFDERAAREECITLLSRYPNGLPYDQFTKIYENHMGKRWCYWDGLHEIATPQNVIEYGKEVLYILPNGSEPEEPEMSIESLDVDWLYEHLLRGPLSLDEIKSQCRVDYEKLLDLLFVKNRHKFNLIWHEKEAKVYPIKTDQPAPAASDWILTQVAPVNTLIATQDIPGMTYDELEALGRQSQDRYFEVEISQYYSPERFYFRYSDQGKQTAALMLQMKEFYAGPESESLTMNADLVQPGVVCAAPYELFGYHRVSIVQVDATDALVFYLDYGTEGRVPISQLRRLLRSFCSFPAQAVEAQIVNIAPVGETWTDEVENRFLSLCNDGGCALWAFLLRKEERLMVELTRVGKEEVHISQALLEEGLAVLSPETLQEYERDVGLDDEESGSDDYRAGFGRDEIDKLEEELDGDAEDPLVTQVRAMITECGLQEAKMTAQFTLKLIENRKNACLGRLSDGQNRSLEESRSLLENVTTFELQQQQLRQLAEETGMDIDI